MHYLIFALFGSLTMSSLVASAQTVRSENGAAKTNCGFAITLQTTIKRNRIYVDGAATRRTDLEILENHNILRRECRHAMQCSHSWKSTDLRDGINVITLTAITPTGCIAGISTYVDMPNR